MTVGSVSHTKYLAENIPNAVTMILYIEKWRYFNGFPVIAGAIV